MGVSLESTEYKSSISEVKHPPQSKTKVLLVACHFVPYHVPLYQALNKLEDLHFEVLYQDGFGNAPSYSKEFQTTVQWDTPLDQDYKFLVIKNFAWKRENGFFSRLNPSLPWHLWRKAPEVVIVQGYATFSDLLALFAAKLFRRKVVFRGEAVLRGGESRAGIKQALKKALVSAVLKNSDAVMYSCDANRRYFEHYGADPKKMFFLPSAVDNQFFLDQARDLKEKRQHARAELDIQSSQLALLSVGRMTDRKRPFDVIAALAQLQDPRLVVVFVGDGPLMTSLREQATRHRVEARFVGFRTHQELSRFYALSDLMIVSSEYDPSPKVLNEALNFGLPVICSSSVGTAGDLVQHGVNGFCYSCGDIDQLVECVRSLANNVEQRIAMGERAREIVSNWSYATGVCGIKDAIDYVQTDRASIRSNLKHRSPHA